MADLFKKSGQKITKKLVNISKKTVSISKNHLEKNFSSRLQHVRRVRLLVFEWILLMVVIIFLSFSQGLWQAESYKTNTFGVGGSYTEGTLGAVNSFNPIFATTSSEKTLSKLLFATLSAPDYSGHIGLGLADYIRTDDNGKVWTVKLKENLVWSDGQPISNQDVIYTVKTLQNPKVNTVYSDGLSGVRLESRDDKLIFYLPSAYSSFPSALNFPLLPAHILEKVEPDSLFEHDFSSHPVTSGPFLLRASQVSSDTGNKVIYLSSNPKYFKDEPLLNNFSIHAFTSADDVVTAINNGSITATAELLPTDKKRVTNSEVYQKQTALSSGAFAFFNTTGGLLKDKSLRKAIQSGLDMRSLRAPLEEESELNFPVIIDRIAGLKAPSLPEYNPTQSRELIASKNLTKPIRITTVKSGYLPALAENLSFQLKNLGFKVELTIQDAGQDFILNVLRPRNYDILVYEVELGSDSDLFPYYHSSTVGGSGLNLSNYANNLADDLILSTRTTIDEKLRASKYHSLLAHWLDDAPAIGIYRTNLSYYFNKNVRTFSEDNRLIFSTDRFTDITNWSSRLTTKKRTT